jgi:hypothetical protein
LTDSGRRVDEGATGEILHEYLHRPALVAKKVIDFGEHETGYVAGACLVDGVAKQSMVWRTLDQIIDQGPVSQMSAAALPAGTEQPALVAALRQRTDDARAARLGMPPILLEHKSQVLSDEFRTRNPTLARR